MLDFIYTGMVPPGTTPLGLEIFKSTTGLQNSQSVLDRRDLLAETIDEVAESVARPNILSIACGHLREAQCSRSVREGRLGRFLALDQDPKSLGVIQREHSASVITTVPASVRSIISGKTSFPELHFVYAAGLFDYLSAPIATRLTSLMFEMLTPGGKLLIANFTPGNHGRGYMETFMDWKLIYRDLDDLRSLGKALPRDRVASEKVFIDRNNNIAYLDIVAATT
jgi:hypothetical protein